MPKSVPKVVPKKSSEIEKWGKIRGMVLNGHQEGIEIILYNFWCGAEGGTRTPTSESPLPPQDSVSTSSTTSANPIEYATSLSLASLFCKLTRRVQLLHVPH